MSFSARQTETVCCKNVELHTANSMIKLQVVPKNKSIMHQESSLMLIFIFFSHCYNATLSIVISLIILGFDYKCLLLAVLYIDIFLGSVPFM